ncbi:hypothetical protein NIES4072_63900 [Nostoc commune NIES-4072]|uniref:Uncharacterized protein n=1 Tax=Nostoc commune NIES-4072 TaxID=2005467 RepID=A0A2R5FYY5_NOSCO|nr:hypothetical protein [Nostoc commune]BBD66341.1 hypothetical protein NIES4070_27060 [Nostoc commune HK-02]GBG22678.1 hypothetical protein NIES4072_63900 [Nostoc commune NIES-4072]
MQTLTLQELFGVKAVQTSDKLIINKSDLSLVGLTPTTNNRAQQLLVAILLQALISFQGYLTEENGNIITDENGNPIGYDNSQLYELLEIIHWGVYIPDGYTNRIRNQFIIHSYVLDNDPN